MHKTISTLALLSALFVFALAATVGCTADDGDLDGKKCDINLPRDQQCISGYSCSCDGGDLTKCFCRKDQAVSQPVSQPSLAPIDQAHAAPLELDDPSVRLLRRLYGIERAR